MRTSGVSERLVRITLRVGVGVRLGRIASEDNLTYVIGLGADIERSSLGWVGVG